MKEERVGGRNAQHYKYVEGTTMTVKVKSQAMAGRGARQRLKGSGGSAGDTASAAEKLRELLCSREAGGAEPRTE